MAFSWYNTGWKYRKRIVIDKSKVSGTADLVNFPVLISHTDAAMVSLSQSAGQDLVITDELGTKLDHEIEKFDTATSRIVIWVRIPTLSYIRDTVLYLYYGNQNCADQQNATAVWNSNYIAVYHLKESGNGTLAEFRDSTANGNHGRGGNGVASAAPAQNTNGKIGTDQTFTSAQNDYISIPTSASLQSAVSKFSLQVWCKPTSAPTGAGVIGGEYTGARLQLEMGFGINAGTNSRPGVGFYDGGSWREAIESSNVPINQRQKMTGTWDGTTMRLIRNGVVTVTSTPGGTNAAVANRFFIGRRHDTFGSVSFFPGDIDEARFVKVDLTPDWDATEFNNQNSPQTFYSLGDQETISPTPKTYLYRVYENGVFVATWTKEVISEPQFRSNINGAASDMRIDLARPFDNFGEDEDVKLNNKVECWVIDKESINGRLLFCGYISGYQPIIDRVAERVQITVFPYASEFQRMILRDGSGNTTLTYNSYDPSAILMDVIDKYRALGGTVNYTPSSVPLTNTVVSYTFITNTVKEVLDKIIELCPVGWYWRVDPDNVIYLQPRQTVAEHSFTLGLNVEKLSTFRRIEDVVNTVYFTGAGTPALFKKYENSGSQGSYGKYEKKLIDQRVSVAATASILSNREIDSKKDPEIRSVFEIIDSNGPRGRGYDIETIKPGQTCQVKNLRTGTRTETLWDVAFWDTDVWDQTIALAAADVIQILSIEYRPDSIIVEASSRLPQIAKRIEDINRNLENSQTVNNPTVPS